MAAKKKVRKVAKKATKKVAKAAPAKKRGRKPGSRGIRYTAEKQAEILGDMTKNGLTLKATSEKYGVSIPTLSNWKRKAKGGVAPARRGRPAKVAGAPKGGGLPDVKLTDKATIQRLLVQVGQGALREAGLEKYSSFEDLSTFVAKLILAK